MGRGKKRRSLELVILLLFLLFIIEAGRIFWESDTKVKISDMKSYVRNKVAVEIVETLSPNLMYPFAEETKDVFFMEQLFIKEFPVLEYAQKASKMETAIENEEAYELILKGEANDENFVDENGNVVIVGEKSEEITEEIKQEQEETLTATQEQEPQKVDTSILGDEQLVKNLYYTIDSTTYVETGELNGIDMLSKDMTLKGGNENPQILIFHTHSQEGFADSVPGDSSTTIVGVGEYLAEILRNTYHYNVIHNTTSYDLVDGKLDRNKAYSLAEPDVQRILSENPSIEVIIDLHRDAMDENTHLVTEINGKQTARFMFFNGMSRTTSLGDIGYLPNPNRTDNMAFSFQLQIKAQEYYPGLTRKIYLKGYRYNLHLLPKTLLVECGAQNNTLQEEKNAMEPLAHLLHLVLQGK